MTDNTPQLKALHSHYVAISGMEIHFSSGMLYWWEQWLNHGFTQADLDLVIAYIHRRIKAKRRGIESLAIRNLIAKLDNFSEDLAIAKAELRNFKPQSQRQKILNTTGRAEVNKSEPKSTRAIIGGKDIETLIGDLRRAVT